MLAGRLRGRETAIRPLALVENSANRRETKIQTFAKRRIDANILPEPRQNKRPLLVYDPTSPKQKHWFRWNREKPNNPKPNHPNPIRT